jgi:hypothetical protein
MVDLCGFHYFLFLHTEMLHFIYGSETGCKNGFEGQISQVEPVSPYPVNYVHDSSAKADYARKKIAYH